MTRPIFRDGGGRKRGKATVWEKINQYKSRHLVISSFMSFSFVPILKFSDAAVAATHRTKSRHMPNRRYSIIVGRYRESVEDVQSVRPFARCKCQDFLQSAVHLGRRRQSKCSKLENYSWKICSGG